MTILAEISIGYNSGSGVNKEISNLLILFFKLLSEEVS